MLHICLDSDSTLPWGLGIQSLLCLGMADMVGISLSWWEGWYLPFFYMDSSSTLYILEFLVVDISLSWAMVDGDSSAGRTGLGSAVLAGFVIGEELPVGSSPLDRLCLLASDFLLSLTLLVVLLNSSSTLHMYTE